MIWDYWEEDFTWKIPRCVERDTCVVFVFSVLPSFCQSYLLSVAFGTAIPISLYIFGKCFSYEIVHSSLYNNTEMCYAWPGALFWACMCAYVRGFAYSCSFITCTLSISSIVLFVYPCNSAELSLKKHLCMKAGCSSGRLSLHWAFYWSRAFLLHRGDVSLCIFEWTSLHLE